MTDSAQRIRHLSQLPDRESIATELSLLSRELVDLAIAVRELEVAGKRVIINTVEFYDALRIKLEGSWDGIYAKEDVMDTRDRLLVNVDRWLGELLNEVRGAVKKNQRTLTRAQNVGDDITGAQGAIENECN